MSEWVPEFANTKVIDPYYPQDKTKLENALTATLGSNVLNIY